MVQYEDQWKRRDVLGVHPQRQEGLYWVGACVPVGRLQSDDMDDLAHIAETYAVLLTINLLLFCCCACSPLTCCSSAAVHVHH